MFSWKENTLFPTSKIVVPSQLKQKILRIAHLSHLGIKKTYEKLIEKYFWVGMYADTHNYVSSCTVCVKNKSHAIPQAPLQNSYLPSRPGEFVSLDFLGPFSNGKHILTIVDHFSRHLELYQTSNITANVVIQSLMDYVSTHGRPTKIQTDLGTQFTSEAVRKFVDAFGICLNFCTTGHPQANGISERVNSSIKSTIKCLSQEGYDFTTAMQIHKAHYNACVHPSSKFSPNLVHFGRALSVLTDTFHDDVTIEILNEHSSLPQILKSINKMQQQVGENLETHQRLQNESVRRKEVRKFKINDVVYIRSKNKVKSSYDGPFTVVHVNSDVTVKVQRAEEADAAPFLIHVDRLLKVADRFPHLKDAQQGAIQNTSTNSGNSGRYNLRSSTRNVSGK